MSAAVERALDVGGYQLYFRCAGQGTPTVVIDAGLGEGLEAWAAAQMQVAASTRVCAYDRAGVGKSEPGPKPRTSQQMVKELRTLLRKANIQGPYVLVGHSLGGLNAQLHAAQYPNEVAGLVLVDPSFHDMLARFESLISEEWKPLWNSQFESDAEGMTEADFVTSCAQVSAAGKILDIPLVVLSAGQPVQLPPQFSGFPGVAVVRVMQEGHAVIARASARGRHIIAADLDHATIHRQPELIVDAIRQVVAEARERRVAVSG
jgi:pimeloyl-ACP methyl ester carboxylesterase